MAKFDFKLVADVALSRMDTVLSHWLPGGKRQGAEYVVINPTRADQTAHSFSINLNTGVWSDFATGDSGGDMIALVAYLENESQGNACKRLASFLGLQSGDAPETPPIHSRAQTTSAKQPSWTALLPVPDNALASCPKVHPKLGSPAKVWDYLDAHGRLLLKVMRFETGTGVGRKKDYRPLCYGTDSNGKSQWAWKQPTEKRPLYGLEQLAMNNTLPVLLCEGEKATDAARILFPDAVAMTWLSGSKAIGKADFSSLAGREVWYWPDNDQAGKDSVPVLSKALKTTGVASFHLLNIRLFGRYLPGSKSGMAILETDSRQPPEWPEKADAADALATGWTADHIALLRAEGLVLPPEGNTEQQSTSNQPTSSFRSNSDGLIYDDRQGGRYLRLGARLDVLGRSRNGDGRSWGLLVSFDDFDGHSKEWNIAAALFSTEGGAEITRGLLDRGYSLVTSREARKRLLEYLGDYDTPNRFRLVERMGWHSGKAFMLPDRVLGDPPEPLHYYSDAPPLCKIAQSGTLDQWKNNVAAYCAGNNLLTFAVSAALAAPLLDVLGSETCGFHFVGDSSLGKSTLLKVAASVYGKPSEYPRTWRATDNALEATAAAHSDCLLVLDEIGQIEPRIVGETVYMLGNGEGKTRATETGASRGVSHRWRLVFLSSGEKSLVDHMAEANRKPQAGMEMRLLTLPACIQVQSEDRARLGIYDTVHDFSGGAELSAHLLAQAGNFHGTPLVAILEHLLSQDRENLAQTIATLKAKIKQKLITSGDSGQVHRAADKFALVAVAGELATEAGLTGWAPGWSTQAAQRCFDSWLTFRGGAGNLEDKQAIEHVRSMLIRYGESRFSRWDTEGPRIDEHAPRTMERWGFRKTEDIPDAVLGESTENIYYLNREGFLDMCKGFPSTRVARLLYEAGALETDKEPGRLTKKVRLPGAGKSAVNCYVIRLGKLLTEEQPEPGNPSIDSTV